MKLRVGLASPRIAASVDEGVTKVKTFLSEASARHVDIVCFPESYIPGLRGQDFDVPPHDQSVLESALDDICKAAKDNKVAAIIGMDWEIDRGLHNVAFVISHSGEVQGYQTKNQIAPSEDEFFVPGRNRQLFEVKGVKFGISICHEGWRYPESVRWAACRGAKIVFHPHHTGSDKTGVSIETWGDANSPYYEKAMICRSVENTVFFASVNYAMRYQESATSIIGPSGECVAHLPYGYEGILVHDIDTSEATGLIASRYSPQLYD